MNKVQIKSYICIHNSTKKTSHIMKNLETSIRTQIGENATNGIYEVFINHQDYFTYYGLGTSPTPNFNQKMFAVIWDNEVENLCLTEPKAWAAFMSICEEEGNEFIK